MRTKIAIFLSLLFLLSSGLVTEGIESRAALGGVAEEEDSSAEDLYISLRSNRTGRFRSREVRSKLSVKLLRDLRAWPEHFPSARGIKTPSEFSQQELYRLQEVFRL